MSSLLFATSKELTAWLSRLAESYRVLAPRQEGPSVVFRAQTAEQLAAAEAADLLKRSTASPKQAMLPQCETLVAFSAVKDPEKPAKLEMKVENPCNPEPTVLFGCRPCDARGFVVLDRPYAQGKFKDPYYMARREATVIVTQACPTSYSTCFCNWLGSGPADKDGSDVLFTAVDDGFVLEAVTPKGAALLEKSGFADAAGREQAVADAQAAAAAGLSAAPDLADAPAKISARFTDDPFWEKETVKCLSCGACTYLCPTCQCFTITDEGSQLDGRRLRSWDSCMSPLFTLETSGHNSREKKYQRMRNRVSHKFSFYPDRYDGLYSCVGCGRCTASCPVSLDIRHMLTAAVDGVVVEVKKEAPAAAPAATAEKPAAPAAKPAAAPAAKPAAAKSKTKKR